MTGEDGVEPDYSAERAEVLRLRVANQALRIELAQALHAMAAREVIEQAKGLLIGYYRCDAAQAFELLRDLSQRANVKLRGVAIDVVELASREGRVHFPGIDAAAEAAFGARPDPRRPDADGTRPSGWR